MTIGKTILSQLKAIDPMSMWAWGAKELANTSSGFRFKTSGMVKWKGFVQITYDEGKDLYDISFMRVRKHEVKVDKTFEGAYAEDLVRLINEVVG